MTMDALGFDFSENLPNLDEAIAASMWSAAEEEEENAKQDQEQEYEPTHRAEHEKKPEDPQSSSDELMDEIDSLYSDSPANDSDDSYSPSTAGYVYTSSPDEDLIDGRYPSIRPTKANAKDVEVARKLAKHLKADDGSAIVQDATCEDCAFWAAGETHKTRGWCCDIWYWVQVKHGGSIGDVEPATDGKTCSHFQRGTGVPVACYDCTFWDQSKPIDSRSNGCTNWSRVCADKEKLEAEIDKSFGYSVGFSMFWSDKPYEDEVVCFDFELNRNLEPGYGADKVKEAKASEEARKAAEQNIYEAGVAQENRDATWIPTMAQDHVDITFERDKCDENNPNAIKVLVNDVPAGFASEKLAANLAPIMDAKAESTARKTGTPEGSNDESNKIRLKLSWQMEEAGAKEGTPVEEEKPKLELSGNTYNTTDDVLDILLGSEDEILDKLKSLPKQF